jgi:hypothetical protein
VDSVIGVSLPSRPRMEVAGSQERSVADMMVPHVGTEFSQARQAR